MNFKRLLAAVLLPALAYAAFLAVDVAQGVPSNQWVLSQLGLAFNQTAAEIAASVTPTKYGYEPYNTLRYGCDSTGIASSTTCFTNAEAVAAAIGSGGTIYMPCGIYLLSNISYTTGGIYWQGAGKNCVFLRNSSTNQPIFNVGNGSAIFHGGFSQFTCGGATGVTGVGGQTCITINTLGQATIDHVVIQNSPSALYRGASFTNLSQTQIYDLEAQGATLDGVTFVGGSDVYMTDSRSDANGGAGWVLDSSQGMDFKHVTAFNDTGICWKFHSASPSTTPNKNNKFVSIVGDTCGSYDVEIDDCQDCTFTDIWAATQQSTSVNTFATGIVVDTQYSYDLTFNGGQALNTNSNCVTLFDSGSAAPFNITFNGFQFGSANNSPTSCGRSGGSAYGLGINGAINHVRINGGMFINPLTAAWLNTSSGTDIVVSGTPVGFPTGVSGPTTVGASPATITNGSSAATYYFSQSATFTATVAISGNTVGTLTSGNVVSINLGPNESCVITWATTAPTYIKSTH